LVAAAQWNCASQTSLLTFKREGDGPIQSMAGVADNGISLERRPE